MPIAGKTKAELDRETANDSADRSTRLLETGLHSTLVRKRRSRGEVGSNGPSSPSSENKVPGNEVTAFHERRGLPEIPSLVDLPRW